MNPAEGIKALQENIQPIRQALASHSVYQSMQTLEDIRIFMEHHIYPVWDFMSLLKSLQRHLTCVSIPWEPTKDLQSRRLVNEIVLEEESDEDGQGGYVSHFEMYRESMKQAGADTLKMDRFLDHIAQGKSVERALDLSDTPVGAKTFVKTTWEIVQSESSHRIAAAFTFGREAIIPDMFGTVIAHLHKTFPEKLSRLHDYLERHVLVDEERHAPMANQMLANLCGDSPRKWEDAKEAALTALHARVALWDALKEAIDSTKIG